MDNDLNCAHERDAMVLVMALQAHLWLDEHANTAIAAPGFIPEGDRCLHCCRFAGEVIRGEHVSAVTHLRCDRAQAEVKLLQAGHQLAEQLLADYRLLESRNG